MSHLAMRDGEVRNRLQGYLASLPDGSPQAERLSALIRRRLIEA